MSNVTDNERWTMDRAADFLEHYAAYIQRVKPEDIEAHPYLPELEYVAGQIRDWFGRCEAGERCSCAGNQQRVKCAHWIASPHVVTTTEQRSADSMGKLISALEFVIRHSDSLTPSDIQRMQAILAEVGDKQ